MSEWHKFRIALAVVESGNNPKAIGDDGQAYGRWQMHPAWAQRYEVPARVNDTWDIYFERCLCNFYFKLRRNVSVDPQIAAHTIAMTFHVGHLVRDGESAWDKEYDEKFTRALAEVSYVNDSV